MIKLGEICAGGCGRLLTEENTKDRSVFRIPTLCDSCNRNAITETQRRNRTREKKS